jgi:hypothetical protein
VIRGLRASRLIALALAAAVALAWLVPSDVPRLVARQQDVLLGRYAEGHLVAAALATLLFLPAAWMLWRGVGLFEAALRMALAAGSAWLAFAIAGIVSYTPEKQRYLETPVGALVQGAPVPLSGITRRRQPNRRWEMRRVDAPGPARTYPDAPPGFPEAEIVLTTDADGFRNPALGSRWEIVVSGDSFAEGSMVSDDEVWSARLAAALGRRVRNVAMSGATPEMYLNNLLAFGRAGAPRLAIVSVYEGNDFKRHRTALAELAGRAQAPAGLRGRLAAWRRLAFEDSPLRATLKRALLGTLGPVRRQAPIPPSEGLSWMPIALDGPAGRHHYAFEPKHLLRLLVRRDRFEASPAWTEQAAVFRSIAGWARAEGVALLFLYVPSTPHVVMPLVQDRISPRALRAFAAFEEDELPPAERFAEEVARGLDDLERLFFDFCAAEALRCLSATEPLRSEIAAGRQVYFSYDPHWTRLGHEAVAELVARAIRAGGLLPQSPASPQP